MIIGKKRIFSSFGIFWQRLDYRKAELNFNPFLLLFSLFSVLEQGNFSFFECVYIFIYQRESFAFHFNCQLLIALTVKKSCQQCSLDTLNCFIHKTIKCRCACCVHFLMKPPKFQAHLFAKNPLVCKEKELAHLEKLCSDLK